MVEDVVDDDELGGRFCDWVLGVMDEEVLLLVEPLGPFLNSGGGI